MTVMVEALVRATTDAEGKISDLCFGVIEWPYADLEPKQVMLVQHGIKESDDDPMFLIALMNDDESMFEVAFSANERIRDFVATSISKEGKVSITRLPSLYDDLSAEGRKIRNYEVPARVFKKSTDAIIALCNPEHASYN
ncbi:hypothetical protein AWH63_10495 [Marinobacter sp. C18]|uniref:hypothetical protein n=1 Tax=Marinobacter sp. C18 TaxID=1772288 RepID=UPI000948ABD0|nr:hypothetical protein [Marinobacter sp. C18]OLF81960.1 hypothetical protein AWH63_10495 [Marinobacter sp. C18]